MSVAAQKGFEIEVNSFVELFSESNTRWVIEAREKDAEDVVSYLNAKGVEAKVIGFVGGDALVYRLNKEVARIDLSEADNAWRLGLSRYMG